MSETRKDCPKCHGSLEPSTGPFSYIMCSCGKPPTSAMQLQSMLAERDGKIAALERERDDLRHLLQLKEETYETLLKTQCEKVEHGDCPVKSLSRECEVLREALEAATKSLETIETQSGKDEYMQEIFQVRQYAHSRGTVARAALQKVSG